MIRKKDKQTEEDTKIKQTFECFEQCIFTAIYILN